MDDPFKAQKLTKQEMEENPSVDWDNPPATHPNLFCSICGEEYFQNLHAPPNTTGRNICGAICWARSGDLAGTKLGKLLSDAFNIDEPTKH